jgi:hypothetical protein
MFPKDGINMTEESNMTKIRFRLCLFIGTKVKYLFKTTLSFMQKKSQLFYSWGVN